MDAANGLLLVAVVGWLVAFAYAQPDHARTRRVLGAGGGVLVALSLVAYFHETLVPFVVPLLLAYLLDPLLKALQRRGIHRVIAVIMVFVLLTGVVTVAGLLLVPPVARQCSQVVSQVVRWVSATVAEVSQPASVDSATADAAAAPDSANTKTGVQAFVEKHVAGPQAFRDWVSQEVGQIDEDYWKQQTTDLLSKLKSPLQWLGEQAGNLAAWTFSYVSGFAWMALLPLTLWYSLLDYEAFHRRAFWLVPPADRAVVRELAESINHALGSYLRGYAVLCLSIGIVQTTVLLLLSHFFGFKYALLVGLYAGCTYFIPYLGTFSTTLLAGLAIFFTGGSAHQPLSVSFVHTLIGMGVVQGISSLFDSVITPNIIGSNTGLHPLLVMFALLAGGKLAGLAGVIISTPVLVCLKIVLDHFIPRLSGPIPASVSAAADEAASSLGDSILAPDEPEPTPPTSEGTSEEP
jgi:predicted PurR-regulated permease PerM